MSDSSTPDVETAIEAARQATEDALSASRAAADRSASTDLVPTGTDSAAAVKAQMASSRAAVIKARTAAVEKQEEARAVIKAQQAALEAQLRALDIELAPLRDQIALLTEGVATMNLYLGRDEEIITLTEGTPAPAGTPIHVRQQILAMDEESAVSAETGGIDALTMDQFDRWITADPANLHQVLPEQRGVVVLVPRRTDRDYGDPWKNAQINEMNKQSWWLIRNGENLYLMTTEIKVGKRLVPARNEFTDLFIDRWTKEPLKPGTKAWLDAEKLAGARERHYMKIALILQGLIDRTAVFHPLPKPDVSLLNPQDYDDGHVVLITDDENQLTTGRTPFYEWIRALNSELRVGMRVMVTTRHQDWPERSRVRYSYDEHERISPRRAEAPQSGTVYTLTRRGDKADRFVFTYPRTEQIWVRDEWGREELRTPKTSASCWIATTDQFVLPIDLVDVATMREYMGARLERHAYIDMFPTLRAAIEFKEAEAAQEAPFRALMASQVALAEGVTVEEAAALVGPVIDWWKIGNKWFRPMQGDPAAEAKAAKAILTERARIKAANDGAGDDAAIVKSILAAHKDALLVARRKDGRYVALTPTPRRWAAPRTKSGRRFGYQSTPADVYVTRHDFKRDGTFVESTPWQIVSPSTVSRWIVLHEDEKWVKWNKTARTAEHLTDPEIEAFIAATIAEHRDGGNLLAVAYDERDTTWGRGPHFELWFHTGPVKVPERALTATLPSVHAQRQMVQWKRERDGSLTFSGNRLYTDNTTSWSVGHNTILDGRKVGAVISPWDSDARANYIVWTDEATLALARRHAQDRENARAKAAQLESVASKFIDTIQQQWIDEALAAKKARFLEDYQDASLWEDHSKSVVIAYPYGHAGKDYQAREAGGAVTWLVKRAVEDGNPPWGITVGDLIDRAGQQADVADGAHWRGSTGHAFNGEFPEDLRALRFPDAPPMLGATSDDFEEGR